MAGRVVVLAAVVALACPAGAEDIGLPGTLPSSRDPIIANLIDDDRAQVVALITLLNEFLAEVHTKERAYLNILRDPAALEAMLDSAFEVEGAQRRFRHVRRNLQAEPNLLGERGALSYVDYLSGKHVPNLVPKAEAATHRNCVTQVGLPSDMLACYEHVPVDWELSLYDEIDWYEQAMTEQDGLLLGDFPEMLGRTHEEFYGRYAIRLDRALAAIGTSPESPSLVITGIETGYGADSRPRVDLAADVDAQDRYVLNANMRTVVSQMTAYVRTARERWRQYERLIASEYPPLLARAFARSARLMQNHGRLQEPLYRDLLGEYEAAPNYLTSTGGGPKEYRQLHQVWMGTQQDKLVQLDAIYRCASPPPEQTRQAVSHLADGIFFDPLFIVVELSEEIAPGTIAPMQQRGALVGETPYVKGQVTMAQIAAPPDGIGMMPAGGGLHLERCGLVRDLEGKTEVLEIVSAEEAKTAFGAADEALP